MKKFVFIPSGESKNCNGKQQKAEAEVTDVDEEWDVQQPDDWYKTRKSLLRRSHILTICFVAKDIRDPSSTI